MAVSWREELIARRRREPFEPFRVHVKSGEAFDVFDPTEILVGDVALGLSVHDPYDPDKDYPVCLDVYQVVRIEAIGPRVFGGRQRKA